jgi:hypothetical protein
MLKENVVVENVIQAEDVAYRWSISLSELFWIVKSKSIPFYHIKQIRNDSLKIYHICDEVDEDFLISYEAPSSDNQGWSREPIECNLKNLYLDEKSVEQVETALPHLICKISNVDKKFFKLIAERRKEVSGITSDHIDGFIASIPTLSKADKRALLAVKAYLKGLPMKDVHAEVMGDNHVIADPASQARRWIRKAKKELIPRLLKQSDTSPE